MSYDRLAPTISSKAKKLFGSGNMGQNNWGGMPLSDGLDTRPCKILDPRQQRAAYWRSMRAMRPGNEADDRHIPT